METTYQTNRTISTGQVKKAILVYVALIYVTLPLVPFLVRTLKSNLGSSGFGFVLNLCLIAPAAVLLALALKRGFKRFALVLLPLLIIAASFSLLQTEVEKLHFLLYGILGLMLYAALDSHPPLTLLKVLGLILLISMVDEMIQYYLPNRVGDPRDVVLNMAGGMLGLWVGLMLSRKSPVDQ